MQKQLIFLTGSTGMLGRYLTDELTNYDLIAPTRQNLDLENPSRVYELVKASGATTILHVGAMTDVDEAERNPALVANVNFKSTEAITNAAVELGARLIFVSTSNVFGAEGRMAYNELDTVGSLNYYGKSKIFAEAVIRAKTQNHLIIRPGWMIGGGSQHDKKFVGKIVRQLKDGSRSVTAVNDKFGSLTYAKYLSRFIKENVPTVQVGTVHFAASGVVSRFGIAEFLMQKLGIDGTVLGVSSAQYPLSAPRPHSEALTSLFVADQQDWKIDLQNYLHEFN